MNFAIGPIFINLLVVVFNAWWSKKALESHKYELQKEFIKTKLRTTLLFEIYPKMFSCFKEVEGYIFKLRSGVKRNRPVNDKDIKEADSVLNDATNYLAFKMLFFSPGIKELAIQIQDLFRQSLYCDSPSDEGKKLFEQAQDKLDALEIEMRKELDANKFG